MRASGPRTLCLTLRFIVPPRFPAISSPVTIDSRRKALPGALEEIPILRAEAGLSRLESGLPGLSAPQDRSGMNDKAAFTIIAIVIEMRANA
jgi:hypothetical protein